MQLTENTASGHPLLEALEGNACSYCKGGRLVQDSYKGNEAVICDECGTPGAQVW
ncbi:HVO_A0556 family zinc finger protein [Natrinema versiforme]|uniref:HVO_A0556 family zinc finger protein n=1 Tax=Natrinema versiforme TaxID=88724 RepID=UPI0026B48F91